MIYKLIILIASIFMIYEFTKKRSTAVAQIEPNLTKLQELAKVAYISYAQPKRIGVPEYTGEPTIIRVPFEQNYREPDMTAINAWLKLNGV